MAYAVRTPHSFTAHVMTNVPHGRLSHGYAAALWLMLSAVLWLAIGSVIL